MVRSHKIASWLIGSLATLTGLLLVGQATGAGTLPYRELLVDGRPMACAAVAATGVAQQEGLRGAPRTAPPMAFVFARAGRYGFWMHGVSQPITVAWVAKNRMIGAASMAPETDTVHAPPVPVRLAVEFIAGRGVPPIGSEVSLGTACQP